MEKKVLGSRVRQTPPDGKNVKVALADTGKDAKVEKVTDEMGG